MGDVLAIRDEYRAQNWALLIQECNASGLTNKGEVVTEQLYADGLTMRKGAEIFALVSRGHHSDRIPPRESPRRAHGTLQPVWMKVS